IISDCVSLSDFLAQHPNFARELIAAEAALPGALGTMEQDVNESLHGRTGGAFTLAVGMARIFTNAMPNLRGLIGYWYHFAIMFEALFILTTIDAGTRIGRFLVREFLGKVWKPLWSREWWPASVPPAGRAVLSAGQC